jgi:hypothetical protein
VGRAAEAAVFRGVVTTERQQENLGASVVRIRKKPQAAAEKILRRLGYKADAPLMPICEDDRQTGKCEEKSRSLVIRPRGTRAGEFPRDDSARQWRARLMRRVQLFEIHDQPWFPSFLRDQVTDDLQVLLNIGKPYGDIFPELLFGIERSAANRVLDLCSGAGGPWSWLADALERSGLRISVELSDKYPNAQARERVRRDSAKLRYRDEAVDATRVPQGLGGFRTLFTAFHHFPPEQARAILKNAVESRQGIGVFEIPGRRPLTLLLLPLVVIGDLLVVPFVRPRPAGRAVWRLIWRWLVPIVPIVLLFDGIVSCLRAYSPGELRELTRGLTDEGYGWEIGCMKRGFWRLPITFLVGYPVLAARAQEERKQIPRYSPA